MAQSIYIPIRFSTEEARMLDELIKNNDATGYETRGEFFRLLLWREWTRCKGLPKPKESNWRSAFRVGSKKKGAV